MIRKAHFWLTNVAHWGFKLYQRNFDFCVYLFDNVVALNTAENVEYNDHLLFGTRFSLLQGLSFMYSKVE